MDQRTAEAWGGDVTVSPTRPFSTREVLSFVCGTFHLSVAPDMTTYECSTFHSSFLATFA